MTTRQSLKINRMFGRRNIFILALSLLTLSIYLGSEPALIRLGAFLILDEKPVVSEAVVVLNSGVEYYPRLIEAANLFRKGVAGKIIINGNRKSDTLRSLEKKGFKN